jgi:hypothetical protein
MSNVNLEETQTTIERDEETLQSLGANLVINGVEFPPPTTAVLSLLEIIESPFVIGFGEADDIKLRHINEVLYILKFRDKAVDSLFDMVRYEKMATKSPEFFEIYLKSLNFGVFQKKVFKFAETLGNFNHLEVISQLQSYMMICFNAFDMIPKKNDKDTSLKKKDILTQNG